MSKPVEKTGDAPDQALIERARSGDQEALERLLEAHQDRVYRTALSLVGGDEEAAMEVAQEVLISAFRHIRQFRGDSKFTTWLYRMTVNFAKNRAVSEGRRAARFSSLDTTPSSRDSDSRSSRQYPDDAPSPRAQASGNEMFGILQERLADLPEEFRSVLVLRYIEDQSYEEIADAVGIPIGTVKSRINRARAELRRVMQDVLEGEVAG